MATKELKDEAGIQKEFDDLLEAQVKKYFEIMDDKEAYPYRSEQYRSALRKLEKDFFEGQRELRKKYGISADDEVENDSD